MIFRTLQMRNFKSHTNTRINFNNGITIITGENGAGKTTIFEAIQYALFNKTNNKLEELLKHNSNEMNVELTFTEKGNTYKIRRTRKHNNTTSELYKKTEQGQYEPITTSNKETDDTLKTIIDITQDLFLNAIYIKQGEITDLVNKSSSERKKLITRLLNIDSLEKCWEQMPKIIKKYENKEENIKGILTVEKNTENQLQDNEKETERLNQQLGELQTEQEKLENDKKELLIQKESMEEKRQEHALLSNTLNNSIRNLQQNQKNKAQQLEKHKKIIGYEKELKETIKKTQNINLPLLQEEKEHLSSQIKCLQQKIKETQESITAIKSANGKCPTCQSEIDESRKEQLTKEYEDTIRQSQETIRIYNEKLETLTETIRTQEQLNSRIIELQTITKPKKELETELKEKEYEQKQLENEVNETKETLNSVGYDPKLYDETIRELTNTETLIRKNTTLIGETKGKLKNTQQNNEKLHQDIRRFKKLKKELANLRKYIKLLKECRAIYSKEGVQANIRANIKPNIRYNTREYFRKFNFEYSDLILDDDYNVSVINNGEEINTSMLSGGEQISIALALRLGITKTIAQGNIECLMLDEPTNHLDLLRIQELSKLLNNIDIVPQVLIVTHEQELERVADMVIKVKKTNGTSEVII